MYSGFLILLDSNVTLQNLEINLDHSSKLWISLISFILEEIEDSSQRYQKMFELWIKVTTKVS